MRDLPLAYSPAFAIHARALTLLEHGVYARLVDMAAFSSKPLPNDQALLCRLVNATTPEEKQAVTTVLSAFWQLTGEGWVNSKLEELRARDQRQRQKEANQQWARKQLPRLLLKQGNICAICNTPFTPEDEVEVDHVLPLSKFPAQLERRELSDLQAAHQTCNRKKGAAA